MDTPDVPTQSMPGAKRGSVGKLVFLTFITLGIYGFYWLLSQESLFKSLQAKTPFPHVPILANFIYQITMIGGIALVIALEMIGIEANTTTFVSVTGFFDFLDSLGFIFTIVYYYALFAMRRMIAEDAEAKQYQFKSSGFFTILFGLFYLQHIINKIPETGTPQQPPAPISAGNINV